MAEPADLNRLKNRNFEPDSGPKANNLKFKFKNNNGSGSAEPSQSSSNFKTIPVSEPNANSQSNSNFLNLNPANNLAGTEQNWPINNHTNTARFNHDPNLEANNDPELYPNEPMETDDMPNAYPSNGEKFSCLNSPMDIDTPSGVSHNSNQPMDEANTPRKISDIEASIAALNQRVHQQVLDGDKQWAVPALPRPCPKVSENVKAPEKLTKAIAALVPHRREELLLSGKGAPRAKVTINGVKTSMILDGGAYSNIILLPFLKTLPDMMIAPSNTVFVMADGRKSFSMGTAVNLTLWLGSIQMPIEAAIFNHK
ncbi:hypothetical protein DSO57_1003210 [Entomophthora muscae]|uniref:Uncharacterized protein n=1 Tax=Entomophthora muscae TaxID=34485 RepID=A0ACC2RZP2_9FUNG|nr:hypothetical protein DSO57_1003210 [Entomophthora muscae]